MPEGFTDMSGVNMEDIPDLEKMQDILMDYWR